MVRGWRKAVVGTWIVFSSLATAEAEGPGLEVGARVRVWAPEPAEGQRDGTRLRKVTGTLAGLGDDALRIETSSDQPPVVIARQEVNKVEVSLRRGRRGRGALIGFLVGAAAAAVMIAADSGKSEPSCAPETEWCFDLNILEGPEYDAAGILILGAAGAGLGALVAPGEKWAAVPLERVRLALGPTRGGGLRFGLSLSF